jgi:hypothetical protein
MWESGSFSLETDSGLWESNQGQWDMAEKDDALSMGKCPLPNEIRGKTSWFLFML